MEYSRVNIFRGTGADDDENVAITGAVLTL